MDALGFKKWLSEELVAQPKGTIYNPARRMSVEVPYKVYKNPSPAELSRVLEIDRDFEAGAILTKDGDLYIWPRQYAEHADVAEKLDITIYAGFYIEENNAIMISYFSSQVGVTEDKILRNPHVKQALGNKIEKTFNSDIPV